MHRLQNKKSNDNKSKKAKKNKSESKENEQEQLKQTKQVKILENAITIQQKISSEQISDIQSKLSALSTNESPSKSILKNRENPNFEQEKEKLDASMLDGDDSEDLQPEISETQFLGRGGNKNKARGPPPRKDTKKRKRKKNKGKNRKKSGRNQDEEDQDDEQKENDEENEQDKEKIVRFYEQNKNKKVPKNIVDVALENRKGNKKVTVVRGFIEKSKDKEQRIKSEFMKKFATSCNVTYQNPGTDKGPKQVVLMGDKRYDFMKYLKDKFPKAGKLLYYRSKKYGLTPAVDPDHGFVMPPP